MLNFPYHVFLVHFPIALMLIAVGYDVWALKSRLPELHGMGYRMTLWAALGGAAAAVTGIEIIGNLVKTAPGAAHAAMGLAATLAIISLAAVRYSAKARREDWLEYYPMNWLVLELVAGIIVLFAAITGHRLVFG